ncbi:MAG: fatty acid desaturase [Gammaproteobacteria bacterium]
MNAVLEWLSQGLWPTSVGGLVLYTLIVTHITIVAVTVYLHRHSAHRAVDLHPALRHFFRFWLWLTTGMITREWTAIHRKHHATCETADDPHSPQVQGLGKIMLRGTEAYRAAAVPDTLNRYGAGTPDDWLERHVYTPYNFVGVGIMLVLDVLLFGVIGLTIWAVQMMWIPVLAAGVINGIGHYYGYRNFECGDAATNISPWGILIGGEELHNNHHTYPNSAKLSQKPWEFDLGWAWIRLFSAFGLARARSTGPVVARVPGKTALDIDTVWAVLNDRFRIMSRYAEQVVTPLVEQELARAGNAQRAAARAVRRLLCREESLVSDAGREARAVVLAEQPVLRTVYEFKQRLLALWAKRGGNAEELVRELKQWCAETEAAGIDELNKFVREPKSPSVPRAKTPA